MQSFRPGTNKEKAHRSHSRTDSQQVRLSKEPEVDEAEVIDNIPAELISVYNSTMELNEEQAATPVHQPIEDPMGRNTTLRKFTSSP